MKAALRNGLAGVLVFLWAGHAFAQQTKSAPLARQLAAALDAAKLESIAAKDPTTPDTYVAALYFKGLQLLAVSAAYSAPPLLDARIAKKEYRDVYIDLNSAAMPDTKFFAADLGIDGLNARREGDAPADSVDTRGRRTAFDGQWRQQQLSEDEYLKIHAAADERYAAMLTALLAEVKKTS
jgi:hypothetical protein